jgi:hypothetical protein
LTFESDTWLRRDFVPRLCEAINHANQQDLQALQAAQAAQAKGESTSQNPPNTKPWDYMSLGEGVGTRPPGCPYSYYAPSRAWVPPHNWVFRCTDSMLFTTDYLERLSKTILPFKEIIDWEMNFQLMLNKGKAYWADPPLAEQGSCYSRLQTSLPA